MPKTKTKMTTSGLASKLFCRSGWTTFSIWLGMATLLEFQYLWIAPSLFVNMDDPSSLKSQFRTGKTIRAASRKHEPLRLPRKEMKEMKEIEVTTPSPRDFKDVMDLLLKQWKYVQGRPSDRLLLPFTISRLRQTVDEDAITVTVHSDADKLNRLLFLIQRWHGPVSASIYIQSPQQIEQVVLFIQDHQVELEWVDFHMMLEDNNLSYPHNMLRNMALRSITSDYFLALDVDFVTPPEAHQGIQELIRTDASVRNVLHNRTFLVLPAFDRVFEGGRVINEDQVLHLEPGILPCNRTEVKKMWNQTKLEPFHLKKFEWGHGATQFKTWRREAQNASFYPTKYEFGFEPYVLGYLEPQLPRYWPGFRGFAYNKYTWFVEAHFKGWNFAVLRDYFVVHLPHAYGNRTVERGTHEEHKRFKQYLWTHYRMTAEEYNDI